MKRIKVSAVIPCYNAEKLISAMIDCFLRQTLTEWELIILDDGSTDNTLDILKEYSKRDMRIKTYSRDREPKGTPTSRNIGLSKAEGEYIVIFDADDLIADTCLEKRVQFMDKNPDIDYASFPARIFTDEKKLPIYTENEKMYGVNDKVDLLSGFLKTQYPFTVWTNIYRNKSIINIRYIEEMTCYEDFDFIISGILSGLKHKFSDLKEIDYYYRVSGNSGNMCSNFVTDEKCAATISLFSQKLEMLKCRSDYDKRKKEFSSFIVLHFERIIVDGSHRNNENYILFCRKYYSKAFSNTLSIISKLTLNFKTTVFRKLILYLLTTIIFFRKQSLIAFAITLKHWK